MSHRDGVILSLLNTRTARMRWVARLFLIGMFAMLPLTAMAQSSPFDTGFTHLQNLFTGTIAKVASLIAIVIGGFQFAHGEPGAKKALAGVAAGTESQYLQRTSSAGFGADPGLNAVAMAIKERGSYAE